jgi:hypothetical protein
MLCGAGSLLAPAEQQSLEFVIHLGVWLQAPGTEYQVEGTCGAAKSEDLNHLVPTSQQNPWSLLALGYGLLVATEATADMGDTICRQHKP